MRKLTEMTELSGHLDEWLLELFRGMERGAQHCSALTRPRSLRRHDSKELRTAGYGSVGVGSAAARGNDGRVSSPTGGA